MGQGECVIVTQDSPFDDLTSHLMLIPYHHCNNQLIQQALRLLPSLSFAVIYPMDAGSDDSFKTAFVVGARSVCGERELPSRTVQGTERMVKGPALEERAVGQAEAMRGRAGDSCVRTNMRASAGAETSRECVWFETAIKGTSCGV